MIHPCYYNGVWHVSVAAPFYALHKGFQVTPQKGHFRAFWSVLVGLPKQVLFGFATKMMLQKMSSNPPVRTLHFVWRGADSKSSHVLKIVVGSPRW